MIASLLYLSCVALLGTSAAAVHYRWMAKGLREQLATKATALCVTRGVETWIAAPSDELAAEILIANTTLSRVGDL